MGRLIYSSICSLDGYVADRSGSFEWATPDPEVHAFVNTIVRPIGTHLLGRRMHEVMAAWDRPDELVGDSAEMREFAELWAGADKVVYSRTLETVASRSTRLEREFDAAAVRRMKRESIRDLSIAGPTLAAHALREGLVDECLLFLTPMVVGGGTGVWPDGLRQRLELLDERRFDSGVVFLRLLVPNDPSVTRAT